MRLLEVPADVLISDRLRELGLPLAFDCGGRGRCGKCRVEIVDASGERHFALACQTYGSAGKVALPIASFSKDAHTPETDATDSIALPTLDERRGALALAVDLGTTTIVCALLSLATGRTLRLASARNPQFTYGADVLSRIAAASSASASNAMRSSVARTISALAQECAEPIGLDANRIVEIALAGNTAMEFLFVGRDVQPLGVAPFTVERRNFDAYSSRDALLEFAPDARVRIFPVLSAFVGGDALSGFAYLRKKGAFPAERVALLLDVGTNGETILSARGRLFASSTAAGPAFEGALLSQGSLAKSGAISGVEYSLEPPRWRARVVANARATSICGSGAVDALAAALEFDLLAPNGRLRAPKDLDDHWTSARLQTLGKERALLVSDFDCEERVYLTQRDIRQAQLAIAAMKVGLELTLGAAGLSPSELDALYLAGGFGSALNLCNARRVGLLPRAIPEERASYCGNAALKGCEALLKGELSLETIEEESESIRLVDLAAEPNFADAFAKSMRF